MNGHVYNPQTGSWTTQDPMGFAAGDSNLYRYVNNGPTDATDPSGDITLSPPVSQQKQVSDAHLLR